MNKGAILDILKLIFGLVMMIIAGLAMLKNYSVMANLKERTFKLEKKNGHEQHQIDQLKQELEQTKQELSEQKEINLQLMVKVQQLEKILKKYQIKTKHK
jgi:ribosomal protein L9